MFIHPAALSTAIQLTKKSSVVKDQDHDHCFGCYLHLDGARLLG